MATGLSSISSKKLPSFSNNGFSSSSSKHLYDGVFGSSKVKSSGFCSFSDNEYGEIFGCSNGGWERSCSSIPVLDLPDRVVGVRGGREIEYCGVFGGDKDVSLCLLDGEELFGHLDKKAKTSSTSLPRGHTKEANGSPISSQFQNGQAPTNGFCKSFDDVKHLEPKTNEMLVNETISATNVARAHAIPGSTYVSNEAGPSKKIGNSRTPTIEPGTELGTDLHECGKHSRNTGTNLDVGEQKNKHDASSQKPVGSSESNAATILFAADKPINQTNGAIHVGSTNSLHEVEPSQKTQATRMPVINAGTKVGIDVHLGKEGKHSRNTSSVHDVNEQKIDNAASFQKAPDMSGSNSAAASLATLQCSTMTGPCKVAKDDNGVDFDVKVDSRAQNCENDAATLNPSHLNGLNAATTFCEFSGVAKPSKVDFDVKVDSRAQNCENDAATLNPPHLNGSNAATTFCEISGVAKPSKVVKDDADVVAAFDVGKRQGRHSRMTSLDLRGYRQASEPDARHQRKSRLGGSYSFDATHDQFAAHVNVQQSKVVPSSSLPQFFPVESHCKVSENSNCSGLSPSLDEQLDVNSEAAISIAALQRAIEEAEMKIRSAKEFLERDCKGSTKLTFKDTLEAKIVKDNKYVNEVNPVRQKKKHSKSQRVDNEMQAHFSSERVCGAETAKSSEVFEEQKFHPDEGSMKGENACISKSVEGGDKHGGAEWEAAKHLNQLISGVKNRIASFMSWQSESEKKEERKETEARGKLPLLSEEGSKEMKETEKSSSTTNETEARGKLPQLSEEGSQEMKETEKSPSTTTCAGETEGVDNKSRLISEDIEMQEKVGDKVDMVPDTEGPTSTNFLFFTFNSERPWGHSLSEEVNKKIAQGSGELHVDDRQVAQISGELQVDDRQEQILDQMMNELIKDQRNDAKQEGLDDISTSQDCAKSLIGSSNVESIEIVEGLCSTARHVKAKFNVEDDSDKRQDENDRSLSTHEVNLGSNMNEECSNDSSLLEECGNDGDLNEEHGNDRKLEEDGSTSESPLEKDSDRMVIEQCSGNRSVLTYEGDSSQRVNEEIGNGRSKLSDEEDCRSSSEEHGEEVIDCSGNPDNMDGGSKFSDVDDNRRLNEEEPIDNSHCPVNVVGKLENNDEQEGGRVIKEAENEQDDAQFLEEENLGVKRAEANGENYEWLKDQGSVDDTEEDSGRTNGWDENKSYQSQINNAEETAKEVADQASYGTADDECQHIENVVLSEAEEACRNDGICLGFEAVFPDDDDGEMMMGITDSLSEPEIDVATTALADESSQEMELTPLSSELKMGLKAPVLSEEANECMREEMELTSVSTKNTTEFDGIEYLDGTTAAFSCENSSVDKCEANMDGGDQDTDGKMSECNSDNISESQTEHLHEFENTVDVEEVDAVSNQKGEKCSVEAAHRRRRWFETGEKIGAVERPSILEGYGKSFDADQDVLEESEFSSRVEVHADEPGSETTEVVTVREANTDLKLEDNHINVEVTPKRRRWFVKRGEAGIPEPPSLFEGIKMSSGIDHEPVNEIPLDNTSDSVGKLNTENMDTMNFSEDDVISEEKYKLNVEATPRRKRWFESGEKVELVQHLRNNEDAGITTEINQKPEATVDTEKLGGLSDKPSLEEKDDVRQKVELVDEPHSDLDTSNQRKKEKEKERLAVEKVIREARERAFAEARERARRDAAEKPSMEVHQKSGAQDKMGKVSAEASPSLDNASMEAKLRAERAAVERATAEARERALQKALSEKTFQRSREQTGRHPTERSYSLDPKFHNSSTSSRCSDPLNERNDVANGESAQRHKAVLERQKRTMERAAKALEDKNKRDLLAQKEQAARNMLADALDAEVRRWSSGKEGNLRALLSTLQYILGSDSGWQAVSLTDLVSPTAVRKAYKKANLCVHPDKLQQRGATIQQKYICEKVFDLLKDAWRRFNPDDR